MKTLARLAHTLGAYDMAGWMTQQEIEEQSLDFDERNYTDGAWWSEIDARQHDDDMERLELEAEIFDLQKGGYL